MTNTKVHSNAAGPQLSAVDSHMRFLRSWQFIVLIVCFVLTSTVEVLTFRVGMTSFDIANFLNQPSQQAEATAEDARLNAVEANEDDMFSDTERGYFYQTYQEAKAASRKLRMTQISFWVTGLTMCISAVATLLIVPLLILTPINPKLAAISTRGISVLLKIKLYTTYAQIIGLVLGLSGFSNAMQLFGASIGVNGLENLTAFVVITVIVLVVYVVLLRNVGIIARDIAKAMRTDSYPGAFGHSCGLTAQSILLMIASLLAWIVALLVFLYMYFITPTSITEALNAAVSLLPGFGNGRFALCCGMMWLLFSGMKFAAIAKCYPHYIRHSQENKGSAVDVLRENTDENATPVYYIRK